MADPAERASWFVERFWDGFDFRDTTQLRPERLDPAFGEFASAALYADPAVRDASLRRMLDSAARGGRRRWSGSPRSPRSISVRGTGPRVQRMR